MLFLPWATSHPPAELPDASWTFGAKAALDERFPVRAPPPSDILLAIQKVAHTPTWLMGLMVLISVTSAGGFGGPQAQRARAAGSPPGGFLFLAGMALAVLIGSVATSNSDNRFLLTGVPLFVGGSVLAASGLRQDLMRRRASDSAGTAWCGQLVGVRPQPLAHELRGPARDRRALPVLELVGREFVLAAQMGQIGGHLVGDVPEQRLAIQAAAHELAGGDASSKLRPSSSSNPYSWECMATDRGSCAIASPVECVLAPTGGPRQSW